jgi:hypothetical protein
MKAEEEKSTIPVNNKSWEIPGGRYAIPAVFMIGGLGMIVLLKEPGGLWVILGGYALGVLRGK